MPAPEARCLACGGGRLEPWAKARDVEYFTSADEFAYLRCRDCGALSIDPVPEDRLAEIYPPSYYSFGGESGSLLQRIKQALDRRLFRRLLRGMGGPELAALDVGGGTGWMLTQARAVEPRLRRTVIVDLDAGARAGAVRAGHDYWLGRIEDFDRDERYDLVLMLNLIEHVRSPGAVLRKVAAMLKPGGVVLIKTPNHDSLDGRLLRHRNWGGFHCPRHWVLFTPESLAATVTHAGLKIRSLQFTQGAPFWASTLLHLLHQRGLASLDREHPVHRHPLNPLLLAAFAAFDFARLPFARTSQMFAVLARD
jgi:SAM-dependent methyltransferase